MRISGNALHCLLANPVHACGQVKLWDSEAQAGTRVARTRERGRGRTISSRWCVAQGWMWKKVVERSISMKVSRLTGQTSCALGVKAPLDSPSTIIRYKISDRIHTFW